MPDPRLCVQCRQRPVDARFRPFCSERCKMADLGRWLSGEYRIPGTRTLVRADAAGDFDDETHD